MDEKTGARALARQTRAAMMLGVLLLAVALVPVAICIYGLASRSDEIDVQSVGLWALLFIVFGVALIIAVLNGRKQSLKKISAGYSVITFECFDGFFTADVRRTGSEFGSFTRGDWYQLTSVTEYADMWLLVYENVIYTLLKSETQGGSAEELSAFFRMKAGAKYKVKKK